MDEKRLLDLLASGTLTREDVLDVLEWQLSLPAEQMDTDLIAECDLLLDPDAPGPDKAREDALFASLLRQIDAPRPDVSARRARSSAGRRRPLHKALIVALATLLLLALAVGGVAYGYHRGVLNFTDDFGFAKMVSQRGAEDFVSSGVLAHQELEHVTIDVLEAVYDGAELRVVYGLTAKDGQVHLMEHSADSFVMPGSEEGEVCMCDFLLVNGQDAYFYNTWEAAGAPGQVLYYLQTNLPAWGVDVTGADELVIGLPMFPISGPGVRRTLDFTIPAAVPEGLVRTAEITEADSVEGRRVELLQSVFSPLNGYIQLRIDGLPLDEYRRRFTGWCSVYAMDGALLADCHPEGPDDGEDGSTIASFTITPPEGEWPDAFVIALEYEDYSPDLEVVVRLSPAAS